MKKRFFVAMAAAAVALSIVGSAGASGGRIGLPTSQTGLKGIAQFNAHATTPSHLSPGINGQNTTPGAPIIGTSWSGVSDNSVSPPDPNGAIGPSSYVEIINLQMAIYSGRARSSRRQPQTLTGHSQFNLSDPMVLWDPTPSASTTTSGTSRQPPWPGASARTRTPRTSRRSLCNYTTSFGYSVGTYPDYPKLGQTKNFLLIGVNYYPSFTPARRRGRTCCGSSKPQGSAPITTCPAAVQFKTGKFADVQEPGRHPGLHPGAGHPDRRQPERLRGDLVGHRVPRHLWHRDQDHGPRGAAEPDANPTVPQLLVTGKSVTVPTFTSPPDAPQKGTIGPAGHAGRPAEHAVSAIDPGTGKTAVWTAHTVSGGAGSQIRWYEINPTPMNTPIAVAVGTSSATRRSTCSTGRCPGPDRARPAVRAR